MLDNEFILNYITKLIDITNIQAFFRVRKMHKKLEIFEISYIEGGKISLATFMENFNEDEQNLKYKFMGFSDTIEQAIYNYKNLDIFCDNYMMNYMKEAKLKSLTIEPIVAYIYAKKTEFKNIRTFCTISFILFPPYPKLPELFGIVTIAGILFTFIAKTGMPLSVELGPGMLTSIYDGIQRPLEKIYKKSGKNIEFFSYWS